MKWLAVLSLFLRDLIIGDSWPLTAAVVAILAAGVAVLRLDAVAPATFVLVFAAFLLLAMPVVILIEVSRHAPRRPK